MNGNRAAKIAVASLIGLIVIAYLVSSNNAPAPAQVSDSSSTSTPSPSDIEHAENQVNAVMHDPDKVKIAECIGVKVYEDPQPPGHPPSPEECAQIKAQIESQAKPSDGAVRFTNPADTEFCNQSDMLDRMKGSINDAIDQLNESNADAESIIAANERDRVMNMQDVTAGQSFCQSNDPSICKAEPKPGMHVCHAVLWLQDGRSTSGNFYVDENDLRAIRYMSDAQLRANGM